MTQSATKRLAREVSLNVGLTGVPATAVALQGGAPVNGAGVGFRWVTKVLRHGASDSVATSVKFAPHVAKVNIDAICAVAPYKDDTVTTTSGSKTVGDPLITTADYGRAVSASGYFPPGSYVGTVTPGVGYSLSSTSGSQTDVNALATGTTTARILTPTATGDLRLRLSPDEWPLGSTGFPGTDLFVTATAPTDAERSFSIRLASDLIVSDTTNLRVCRLGTDPADTLCANLNIIEIQVTATEYAPAAPDAILPPASIGGSKLLRGANVTIKPSHSGQWVNFWSEWDWAGWIKPQIDHAVTLGLNSIRLIGCTEGVAAGTITLSTYLTRWAQFINYCHGVGLLAYPCGGDLGQQGGGVTDDQMITVYVDWATAMDTYPDTHVFGLDVSNEAYYGVAVIKGRGVPATTDYLTDITEAIRPVTSKPLAHSLIVDTAARWWTRTTPSDIETISDFYDFHIPYPTSGSIPTVADATLFFQRRWANLPILIGEVAIDLTVSSPNRTAHWNAVKAILASNPAFFGAMAWALADQGADDAHKFGLFDGSGNERHDVSDVLKSLPITR